MSRYTWIQLLQPQKKQAIPSQILCTSSSSMISFCLVFAFKNVHNVNSRSTCRKKTSLVTRVIRKRLNITETRVPFQDSFYFLGSMVDHDTFNHSGRNILSSSQSKQTPAIIADSAFVGSVPGSIATGNTSGDRLPAFCGYLVGDRHGQADRNSLNFH